MENLNKQNPLVEDTTGSEDPNVASTDSISSVGELFQQTALPSLGRSIFSVLPTVGPTAGLFNIRKKAGTNNFELVRANINVYPSASIATGLTQEVIQDIRAQYGMSADKIIGTLLRGLANDQENTRTMEFLEANALLTPDLDLTNSLNGETIAFEVGQRTHELILKANSKTIRTYDSFCVLPYVVAASFASLNQYIGGMDKDERGLFISEVGNTVFFMNPDPTSTTAYVGLLDKANPNKSSAIFSPYVETVVEAQDPTTGNLTYHIFNRFAITASPLHETGNEMLFKFDIIV